MELVRTYLWSHSRQGRKKREETEDRKRVRNA